MQNDGSSVPETASPMYGSDASRDKLKREHSHRAPSADAVKRLRRIRQAMLDAAVELDALLPASREKSLALTNLDQARMWACSAAVADGEIREELVANPPALV